MSNAEIRVNGVSQEGGDSPSIPAAEDGSGGGASTLEQKVVDALRQVHDPEIPVNIYDLGLIYDIDIDAENHVSIKMTLTSPACPVAESLPGEVRAAVGRVPEVVECEVDLVWEPQWGPDRMTDVAKLKLGML